MQQLDAGDRRGRAVEDLVEFNVAVPEARVGALRATQLPNQASESASNSVAGNSADMVATLAKVTSQGRSRCHRGISTEQSARCSPTIVTVGA
jgi:hypothetical protein